MKFICSLVTVSDILVARNFYENILDQKVKFDFGENVTFHGDFALHLESHFKQLIDKEITSGGNNFELYFEYDQVDEIVSKLKLNEVEFVHDIREQPWRQKVVRFYDPDKNIVEIGESMPFLCYRLSNEGLSIKETAKVTGLAESFIAESIKSFQ
jgi:catechol 2,3-dioxygenase-like lactoylglutathione lyase family enzyme